MKNKNKNGNISIENVLQKWWKFDKNKEAMIFWIATICSERKSWSIMNFSDWVDDVTEKMNNVYSDLFLSTRMIYAFICMFATCIFECFV